MERADGEVVVSIDVGSTSARAGIFDRGGRLLATATAPFEIHRPARHHAEHDSEQIWRAVCQAARAALSSAGGAPSQVRGLAFDATCSLVLLDAQGSPATISSTGEDRWNVIMWADHRAVAQAQEITATRHRVLDYVGGTMSPEMEIPKLLWLKRHLPAAWARYATAFDLADYLTWRASGNPAVSACTVTCKWAYLNHEKTGWQADFLDRIGLADLVAKLRLPARALQLGHTAGQLTPTAARELGLAAQTPVGVGLIDAHAGGLGLLAGSTPEELQTRLALIAGTSNCLMAVSPEPRRIPGVWGPYFGAMLPGHWLSEGGQSSTGALLDHVLDWHAEGRALGPDRHERVTAHIGDRLRAIGHDYARELLVVPDFNGNRSPIANPNLRGMIHGLDLDSSFDGMARLYLAAAAGIGYGTRHIIEALNRGGYAIKLLHFTGGHAKSEVLVQLYADTTGCEIVLAREPDAVLLGGALAAAVAAGWHTTLDAAGRAMVHTGRRFHPAAGARNFHDKKYEQFLRMSRLGEELAGVSGAVNRLE
jgi:FGGY-family pentulose kinase